MSKHRSLEVMCEIWDDGTGDRFEIGPDRDGLDMVEIRFRDRDGSTGPALSFDVEQVPLMIDALTVVLAHLNASRRKGGTDAGGD